MAEAVATVPMTNLQIGGRGEIVINGQDFAREVSHALQNADRVICILAVGSEYDLGRVGVDVGERLSLARDNITVDADTGTVTIFDHNLNRFVYNAKTEGLVGSTYFKIGIAGSP